MTLDVIELLTCNEPGIGLRFFRNLAVTLGRRLEGQMHALFAGKGLGAEEDAGTDVRYASMAGTMCCTRRCLALGLGLAFSFAAVALGVCRLGSGVRVGCVMGWAVRVLLVCCLTRGAAHRSFRSTAAAADSHAEARSRRDYSSRQAVSNQGTTWM